MIAVVAASPARPTLVRAVCVREWREALGNKLLVGMTLLPPVVILVAGIAAVAAAAVNPPSDRDVQALYAAAPAVAGLDPKEAVQGFIATYFLILFMLIPTVVPLTMAIYSVIGEKASRTLEPLLATPVGVGDLLFAKSLASTVPSVIVTWSAYGIYLATVIAIGSHAAVQAVTAPRWILAIVVLVPLLTLLSVNLGILISTRPRRRSCGGARDRAGHGPRRARQRRFFTDDDRAHPARSHGVLARAARVPAGEHTRPLEVNPVADHRCSFCGKRQDQVKKLIAGGGSNRPFICDECVALCQDILDENLAPTPPESRRTKWLDRLRRMAITLPR